MRKKRPLGQNFLIDEEIACEIVRLAHITRDDHVVEIGPGRGILTQYLLEQAGRLTAIEIDPHLCSRLLNRYSTRENFHLIEGDALKFDYGSLGKGLKIVSNLPYYAATHILKRLIAYRDHVAQMTVMLQKEVVDRLAAQPGQKEYGSLSVFLQYHCEPRRVLEVGKAAFSPAPKINSAVIQLTPLDPRPVQVKSEKIFFSLVHAAFLHKRKMLKNNLGAWQKQFRQDLNRIELAGVDLSRRAETLSLEDFAVLSNHISANHE
ncbi:MAG: rRNA methyltransferase [Nitrospinae bacterium CG11_big_fil_rev_8_21_14_0_20_56_8]|nr:MAG: rRNA methyltransferase [Nitrospinae bacterium CG11_big_fil_rev_8_21_14_0_20_56_8]